MKTITLGNKVVEFTPEYRRRTQDALNETYRLLEKELTYPEDLQHTDMIGFYRSHITRLETLLKD